MHPFQWKVYTSVMGMYVNNLLLSFRKEYKLIIIRVAAADLYQYTYAIVCSRQFKVHDIIMCMQCYFLRACKLIKRLSISC